MSDLTKSIEIKGDPNGSPKYGALYGVAAGVVLYHGALVFVNSSGYAVTLSPDQTMGCIGYNDGDEIDNTSGSNGDKTFRPRIGEIDLTNGSGGDVIAADDAGKMAYASDNQTANLTSSSGTRAAIGSIQGMNGSKVRVLAGQPLNREVAGFTAVSSAPVLTSTATSAFSAEVNLGALSDGLLAIDVTGGVAAFTNRSVAVGSAALVVSNADGQAGNPTLNASVSGVNLSALAGTGFISQSGGAANNGTFVERSIAVGSAALTVANGDGVAANPTLDASVALGALSAFAGTGFIAQTGGAAHNGTFSERSIAVGSSALTVANPAGVAGNPTLDASVALGNVSALAGTGFLAQSGGAAHAGTFVERSIAVGSTALTISNADGVAGNPSLNASVAGVNLSALAGTGFIAQSGGAADNGTFVERSITIGAGLDVTNPAGIAGNPLVELDDTFVRCATITATGGAGGSEAGSLTLNMTDLDGNALGSAKQILIVACLTQYQGGIGTLLSTLTFSAASAGSIISSGAGWCLAKTDATGEFTCALTDTADETVWFNVQSANAVSLIADICTVVGSVTDSAAWSA